MRRSMRGLMRPGFKIVGRLRRVYWFVFRPRTSGVKCVVVHDGRWLMIRNSYGSHRWTFPGGGIDKGEAAADAAIREVSEEVGISLADVVPIGEYFTDREYKRDTVYCFTSRATSSAFETDPAEIAEARWIAPDELPDFRTPSVDRVVAMLAAQEHA